MNLLEKVFKGNILISSVLIFSTAEILYEASAGHFSKQTEMVTYSPGISPSTSKYELSSSF